MTVKPLTRCAAVALAAAGLFGCTGTAGTAGSTDPGARTGVAIDVQPRAPQVLPGGSVSFAATVTGAADTTVSWAVVEAAGGTIAATGDATSSYVAPQATGTYHVVAKSNADPTVSGTATVTVTQTPTVGVTVTPHTVSVAAGGSFTFVATVTGSSNTQVTWSVQEASGCGSVTRDGVYSAPSSAATCHVVVTSVADGTKKDTATVTVSAPPQTVTISLSPPSASTSSCQSVTFTATVTGSTNKAVTWSVQEGSAGGTVTTSGSNTASGVYTAPSTAGTYHVVATSQADSTKSATAAVTASTKILSVAVNPQQVTVQQGGSTLFTATVTTTCGTSTN